MPTRGWCYKNDVQSSTLNVPKCLQGHVRGSFVAFVDLCTDTVLVEIEDDFLRLLFMAC